jgi:hypothetical protein
MNFTISQFFDIIKENGIRVYRCKKCKHEIRPLNAVDLHKQAVSHVNGHRKKVEKC